MVVVRSKKSRIVRECDIEAEHDRSSQHFIPDRKFAREIFHGNNYFYKIQLLLFKRLNLLRNKKRRVSEFSLEYSYLSIYDNKNYG